MKKILVTFANERQRHYGNIKPYLSLESSQGSVI